MNVSDTIVAFFIAGIYYYFVGDESSANTCIKMAFDLHIKPSRFMGNS